MMDEIRWNTSGTPGETTPTEGLDDRSAPPPTTSAARETDAYAEAGSQIADLIGRFVEEVGGLRRDAQVATDSARAEYVDASRLRQEAMKLRADAEAEATRIMDAARAEADRIRVEAEAEAADAKRVVGEVVDDIERAQRSLTELIGMLGSDVGERRPSEGVVVVPNAPSKDPSES